jgi:Ca2+-binding EF-hand superfamily protein
MRYYNKGTQRNPLVCYKSFVNGLRAPLEGKRQGIVQDAFRKINCEDGAECFTIAQAKSAFAYEEFEKWCEAIEVANNDDEIITAQQFCDFYADIGMTMFNDNEFLKFVSDSWNLSITQYSVNQKDVETLLAAIRHNLMKYGSARKTEEYILRELFREFDTNNSGLLSIGELRDILFKINLTSEDRYLNAILSKMDTNRDGVVEFEEFCKYVTTDPYTRV